MKTPNRILPAILVTAIGAGCATTSTPQQKAHSPATLPTATRAAAEVPASAAPDDEEKKFDRYTYGEEQESSLRAQHAKQGAALIEQLEKLKAATQTIVSKVITELGIEKQADINKCTEEVKVDQCEKNAKTLLKSCRETRGVPDEACDVGHVKALIACGQEFHDCVQNILEGKDSEGDKQAQQDSVEDAAKQQE